MKYTIAELGLIYDRAKIQHIECKKKHDDIFFGRDKTNGDWEEQMKAHKVMVTWEQIIENIEAVLDTAAQEFLFEERTPEEMPPPEPLICIQCGNVSGMLWNGLCAEKCATEQQGFSTTINADGSMVINGHGKSFPRNPEDIPAPKDYTKESPSEN